MQLVRSLLVTGLILLMLGSCGGSSAPPVDQQPPVEQLQPTENPPESPGPTEEEPETTEPATTVTFTGASQPVELPLFDPRLYEPGDVAYPSFLLVGASDGEVVHDEVLISATAIDDTGVNYIILLIDGTVQAETELTSLTYDWDTSKELDGNHLVEFVVRDNGNHIGVMTLNVTVDNASDWEPPNLTVTVPRCFYDDSEHTSEFEPVFGDEMPVWWVAGIVDLKISADDSGGIRWIELYESYTVPDLGQTDPPPLATSDGEDITYTFDSTEIGMSTTYWLAAIAEDSSGNVKVVRFKLLVRNEFPVSVWLADGTGHALKGAEFFLMPRDWDDSMEFDPELAVAQTVCPGYGSVELIAPVGRNWFVARFEDQIKPLYIVTTPDANSGFRVAKVEFK